MKLLVIITIISFSVAVGFAQQGQVNIQQDDKIADLLDIYKSSNESHEYYS